MNISDRAFKDLCHSCERSLDTIAEISAKFSELLPESANYTHSLSKIDSRLNFYDFFLPDKDGRLSKYGEYLEAKRKDDEAAYIRLEELVKQIELEKKERDSVREEEKVDELDDDPDYQEYLAHEEELDDVSDLDKIKTIDMRDPDGFIQVSNYSIRLSMIFKKLASCEYSSEDRFLCYQKHRLYKESVENIFHLLVGYWSSRNEEINKRNDARTEKSSRTKQDNRAIAKREVIRVCKNYIKIRKQVDKDYLNKLKISLMLLDIKKEVDQYLSAKKIYGRRDRKGHLIYGISTRTIDKMLREAIAEGKIESFPFKKISGRTLHIS